MGTTNGGLKGLEGSRGKSYTWGLLKEEEDEKEEEEGTRVREKERV